MSLFNLFRYIVLLIFVLACSPVLADVYGSPASLKLIAEQIPAMNSIKCNFKQEKHLSNISKPLISKGNFEFIKDKGVYFHTTYPIVSEVNYTNENYRQVNEIVKAISAKKYEKLEQEFNFYFTGNSENWTLGLKPNKNSHLKNYITSITICGDIYIKQINISQTNGNKTIIWFTK